MMMFSDRRRVSFFYSFLANNARPLGLYYDNDTQ